MTNAHLSTLSLMLALAFAPAAAMAAGVPLAAPQLLNASVYGKTYTTLEATSTVHGNVSTGTAATLGAGATVTGNLSSGQESTAGAGATIGGNIVAGGATTIGAGAKVAGNVNAAGAATVGAGAQLAGGVVAGDAVSIGTLANVNGSVSSGGAAGLGADAHVIGNVAAVGAVTVGAGATIGSQSQLLQSPVDLQYTMALAAGNLNQWQAVDSAHAYLSSLGPGSTLATTMTTNTSLFAGVYSAASLSTTAGTTLTLDGQGLDNQTWVFNIADYLVTGASTKVVLINGGLNDAVYWNTGTYAALGATASLLGTVIAGDYITVGAGSLVSGIGTDCGGLFSATSYVSAGAGAVIGSAGCSASQHFGALPEPTSFELVLAGLGLLMLGLGASRRLRR